MSRHMRIGTDPDAALPEVISVSTVDGATAVRRTAVHHMLKVERYSLLKATSAGKNGCCIASPEFTAGGHAWRLCLNLNGATEEDAGFVSLYLYQSDAADGTVVHADIELALVHHRGMLPRRRWHWPWRPSYRSSAICAAFSPEMQSWGSRRLITVKKLERSAAFLRDDCFAVWCKVTVVEAARPPCLKKGVVLAQDLRKLGLLCSCNDATCERHHAAPGQQQQHTFWDKFARMCRRSFSE